MSPVLKKKLNRAIRAEDRIVARKQLFSKALPKARLHPGICHRFYKSNEQSCSLLRWLIHGLTILSFCMASLLAHAQGPAHLPSDPTVAHGNVTIDTVGNHMHITNSPNSIINWQEFSIGADQAVYFQQSDASSQVLNRIIGDDPSQILGSLGSNGGVWLVNPHGVLFGQNARIDVAGLVASTLDISNIDFMAGKYNFLAGAANPGQTMNQGVIHTTFGGRVWLLGGQVRNEGLIQTSGGNTVLAAGKSLELIDSGAPNVVVRIAAPDSQAINLGTLVATGGTVDVHGSIVNQEGIIRADSVTADQAGRVTLKASQGLTVADNSVTGASGGNVSMVAGTTTYLAGLVDVSRQQGEGGSIQLNTGKLEGMTAGSLRADGEQGGNIRVEGLGMVGFSSSFSAAGASSGGSINVTGDRVYLLNANVDASGGTRGGTVHLGGGWQGGGNLPHAREVLVGTGSEVKANGNLASPSAGGQGGEIVVWSTQSSQHYGTLQARDGGRIELSSGGEIRQTGEIQAGRGGMVLFDPKNLIITNEPPDSLTLAQTVADGSLFGNQPLDLSPGDSFGSSVALNGGRLAIGANREGGKGGSGAVYLFSGIGDTFAASTLTWQRTIEAPDPGSNDSFGSSVALDGDHLAVSATPDNNIGPDSVYLYNGASSNNFSALTLRETISSEGSHGMPAQGSDTVDNNFGAAVALRGDLLAIGADTGESSTGAVHLFRGVDTLDFTNLSWSGQIGRPAAGGTISVLNMPELEIGDHFGIAISLSEGRMAVGATAVGAPPDRSSAAVHLFSGINTQDFSGLTWQKRLAPGDNGIPLTTNSLFGRAVALDGDNLAVGAFGPVGPLTGEQAGVVHLLAGLSSPGFSGLTWQRQIDSTPSDLSFGRAVALDGEKLAVGQPFDSGNDLGGATYLFNGVSTLGTVIDVGAATFSANPSGTSYITPASITSILNTGSDVTLQANNDVTVSSAILVSEGGSGGNFTIQAGRNITFESNISTDNGNFTAVAGDSNAITAFRDPGTPTLTIGEGVSLNVGAGVATLAAVNGDFINLSGTSAIVTSNAGRWLIYTRDPNSALFGALASGNLALWNQNYSGGPSPSLPGNRYLFGTTQTLVFELSGNLIKTYGDDVISEALPTPTFTGAISNTYGGAVIADSSVPLSSLFSGEAALSSAGIGASAIVGSSPYAISISPGSLSSLTGYGMDFNSNATITVDPLTLTGSITAANKTYDGTTAATITDRTLSGVLGSDVVNYVGGTANFSDKNVGVNKLVTATGLGLSGADAGNYTVNTTATTTADISALTILGSVTAADKAYDATTAATITSRTLSGVLDGDVVSYVGGTANFSDKNVGLTKLVTATGLGLSGTDAGNYAVNSVATTTADISPSDAEPNPKRDQDTVHTAVQTINASILGAFPVLDPVTTGFVNDLAAMRVPRFGRLDLSRMSREEMRQLIEDRREFKEKLFADAIYKLELDPSLANVPLCPSLADARTGLCRTTDSQRLEQASKVVQEEPHKKFRKAKTARLPQIERKFVVLFGIDQYADKSVPPLENAIFDAEVVGKLFAEKLGYEVNVVKNATKADIVRTLNQLSTEMQPQDSVIIYYAGHGYRNEKTGGGYWIPADALVADPTTWISNTDVSSMMSDISAKQMVMIADSCYSGTFAEQKLRMSGYGVKPEEVLAKRSVIVMSSGGDEPVADEGKEGHSIFAWDLMQALRNVDNWQPGTNIFEQVKQAVMKSFPQTPQYGTVKSAGHEAGGEYLFEFRQLE
jgi:filamentous hemagglutinin family protein